MAAGARRDGGAEFADPLLTKLEEILSAAVSRLLNTNADTAMRLAALDGRVIEIALRDSARSAFAVPGAHGVHLRRRHDGPVAVKVSGRIADFIAHDRLRPILYVTAQAGSKTAIEAIKRGAFEYLSKPIDFKLLRQRIEDAIEYRRLTRLPVLVDSTSTKETESDILVGRCRGMQEVYKSIGRFSTLRTPILIEGEVGTGKEMIARTIHQNGAFASGPFRKISSREFNDAELQVELFGGIYAGASTIGDPWSSSIKPSSAKLPALLECSGGTLMIDDIDSWSVASQSRLLRFFQSHAIQIFPVYRLHQ